MTRTSSTLNTRPPMKPNWISSTVSEQPAPSSSSRTGEASATKRTAAPAPSAKNTARLPPTCTSTHGSGSPSWTRRSLSGTRYTSTVPSGTRTGVRIIHTHGTVPSTIAASASDHR